MSLISENKTGIAILLAALILVIFRAVGNDHFRSDATKLAEPSFSRANILSTAQAANLQGNILLVSLDGNQPGTGFKNAETIGLSDLLKKENIRIIRKNDGPVLLYSSETGLAARAWMLLAQTGMKELYIVTDDKDNEVSKNKFRPDMTSEPEF